MQTDLKKVDPQWAWALYTPDATKPWTRALAAHLYRRAGFGANSRQLDEAVKSSPSEIVSKLISVGKESETFRREIDDLARTILNTGDSKNLSAWWLYRILDTPDQLHEKTILFWHGHFATSAEKVQDALLMYRQHELLRKHALGNFGELVQEISRDPAMLIYLDSASNRKAHPNENYARELMELFCLGEGHYSEKDVQEVARCFTGWEIRRGKFFFNSYQHDGQMKTILGKSGEFGGEDAVRVILDQKKAPQFIVKKLIRYFMFDEPQAPDSLVHPLAEQFGEDNYSVSDLVQRILSSQLFFSEFCIGRKVRSPVEFAAGLLRALESRADVYALGRNLAQLGQELFYPPDVKGWDGGRAWINSSTLLGRANLVRGLIDGQKSSFAPGKLAELADANGARSREQIVDWLLEVLVAVQIPADVRSKLIESTATGAADRTHEIGEIVFALCTLPEFQLA